MSVYRKNVHLVDLVILWHSIDHLSLIFITLVNIIYKSS